MKNLNDKRILITGGTSGLGRALAIQFLACGAQVAVIARRSERLAELRRAYREIEIIKGDVSDKNDAHRIYAEAVLKLGHIDVLINNASSLGPTPLRLMIDTDCEDLSAALETNLLGSFRLSKLVLPDLLLRREGMIVNISSDAAVQNYPKWGAYSISKSALDHMTRIFAEELKDSGVHFLAIDPGDMDTPLHLSAVPEVNRKALTKPEESAKRMIEFLKSGEFTPEHRGLA